MATRTESGWGSFVSQPVRVLARTSEAAGVRTLWLQAPPGFSFEPERIRWRCEQMIRNYDPCISCATHFLRLSVERT